MNSTVFCITGWHFPEEFYQKIAALSNVDVYIVSHKPKNNIPGFIFDLFSSEQILIRSNIGYDWGCYQQFITSGLWRNYETVCFMHDDIEILDFGFVNQVRSMLKSHHVIGNGRGEGSVSYTGLRDHPYAYSHSSWKSESFDFQHSTVRGSFFAARRDTLEKMESLEVYWDPFKLFIGFGNWSTKATCGKMEDIFGPNCFGYLSNTFGKSEFITEFVRGQENGSLSQPKGIKGYIYTFIKRISRVYLEIYYGEKDVPLRSGWVIILKSLVFLFSNKMY